MSVSTTNHSEAAALTTGPGDAFSDVIGTVLEVAAAKVDAWTSKFNDIAAGDGPPSATVNNVADQVAEGGDAKQQAGARGIQAGLQGKNPVWAAIKGAWTGGGTKVKMAIVGAVVTLVLLLVLSPVLLLVLLLVGLVALAVHKMRSSPR